jgi:hypothetical protein
VAGVLATLSEAFMVFHCLQINAMTILSLDQIHSFKLPSISSFTGHPNTESLCMKSFDECECPEHKTIEIYIVVKFLL